MALTVSNVKNTVYGDTHVVFADLVIDRYATGGESFSATDLGLSDALEIVYVGAQSAGGFVFDYDPGAGRLVGYEAAETEIGAGTDLSGVPVRVYAVAV